MRDVMLDLETMSTASDAAIVAIGAVAFDAAAGELGPRFYAAVHLGSAMDAGGKVDADTIMFWLQQDKAAKEFLARDRISLLSALDGFAQYLQGLGGFDAVQVWGNASAFDNVILRNAYRAHRMQEPWAWWNDRCYRTLRKLLPGLPAPEFTGEPHHALHDAEHQAAHALQLLRALPGAGHV